MFTVLEAKAIAIVIVTLGSLIFGSFPVVLGLGRRYQNSVILSAILCFGGGVLFATSVIHILPDVRDDLPKWSELIFCVGFLLIYFIDSVISSLNGSRTSTISRNFSTSSATEDPFLPGNYPTSYGTIDSANEPVVNYSENNSGTTETVGFTCTNVGLVIAFTVHAVLEGLVIGIQDTEYSVLLLLAAVCTHKFLVAFCLGAELAAGGQQWQSLICPICTFIFGSDLGIAIGMIFQVDGSASISVTVPLIEGLAGGTLLYIALCEIIPREKARRLPRYAAPLQFLFVTFGFSLMTTLTLFT